jgi:hypothetical protein
MTLTLNVKDVILAGAAALKSGNIQAITNADQANGCSYRNQDGIPCFIGAGISDSQWRQHIGRSGLNEMSIDGLVDDGQIKLDLKGVTPGNKDPDDDIEDASYVLMRLQQLHDAVVNNFDGPTAIKVKLADLRRQVNRAVKAVEAGKLPKFKKEI